MMIETKFQRPLRYERDFRNEDENYCVMKREFRNKQFKSSPASSQTPVWE